MGTLYISGTAEGKNFKFGVWINLNQYYRMNGKVGQINTYSGPRDLLLNFGSFSRPIISGVNKVREFNFGTRTDRKAYKLGICKRK